MAWELLYIRSKSLFVTKKTRIDGQEEGVSYRAVVLKRELKERGDFTMKGLLQVLVISMLVVIIAPVKPAYSKGMNILLDVCNSYEGVEKIGVLKKGLTTFIRENPGLDINITLFGFPLHGDNEKRLEDLFSVLKARNMIKGVNKTESLEKTLISLKPDKAIYVLISGGKGDWYRIKGLLRERDAIGLQVVGISLPDEDLMFRLLGVASVSGGRYFNAGNALRLKEVLSTIDKEANYNLEIKVFKSQYEELTDYLMWHYRYMWTSEVYQPGRYDEVVDSTYIFPARYNLPAGTYDVKVRYGNETKWLRGVKVRKRDVNREVVNFAKGMLLVRVLNGGRPVEGVERGARYYCWWSEAYEAGRHDKPVEVTRTFPPEFSLVNGRYDIRIFYRGHERWIYDMEIDEGKVKEFSVEFPTAVECPAPPLRSALYQR